MRTGLKGIDLFRPTFEAKAASRAMVGLPAAEACKLLWQAPHVELPGRASAEPDAVPDLRRRQPAETATSDRQQTGNRHAHCCIRYVSGLDRWALLNPSGGSQLAQIARGNAADIDAAVSAAQSALDGEWGRLSAAAS